MIHHAGFWSWQLIAAIVLNAVVQCVTVSAYAARLAGARSGRVGTAISLFNLFVTTGRFASMLYTPILGSLSDRASAAGSYQWQLRWIVLGGTLGVACGGLLMPTFVALYVRGIASFERLGNVPRVMLRLFVPAKALSVVRSIRLAGPRSLLTLSIRRVPAEVLLINTFVTSVYGIGIVSAAYASVLDPHVARTALLSSGLINGAATIAYNVMVDPVSSYITDQSARGERPIEDIRAMVASLAITAIIGFLLSQLLLVPAAAIIAMAARAVTH